MADIVDDAGIINEEHQARALAAKFEELEQEKQKNYREYDENEEQVECEECGTPIPESRRRSTGSLLCVDCKRWEEDHRARVHKMKGGY